MADTGYAKDACLIELDDRRLWAVAAINWQAYGADNGVPPPDFGYPANTCLLELPQHLLMAIVAYYVNAVAGGVVSVSQYLRPDGSQYLRPGGGLFVRP